MRQGLAHACTCYNYTEKVIKQKYAKNHVKDMTKMLTDNNIKETQNKQ